MHRYVTALATLTALLLFAAGPIRANEACRMLEPADAEAVFGSGVETAIDETMEAGGMTAIRCRYRTVADPVRYADLTLTRYESAEMFKMVQDLAEDENDEPVADLGERALWHKQAGSLSVFVGTEELVLHVFNQPAQVSKEEHIALMREVLARR